MRNTMRNRMRNRMRTAPFGGTMRGCRAVAILLGLSLSLGLCVGCAPVKPPPSPGAAPEPPEFRGRSEQALPGAQTAQGGSCVLRPLKDVPRQRWDAVGMRMVAGELQAQVTPSHHLSYRPPAQECVLETLTLGEATAVVHYNPLEKGSSTLLYRIELTRPGGSRSEVLVLYSGIASFVSGQPLFHVSEERDGLIAWYAMYSSEPSYAVIVELLRQIASGSARPLMSVRWPPGAKKPQIVSFDRQRLK